MTQHDDTWARSVADGVGSLRREFDPTLLDHLSPNEQVQLLEGLESLVGGERAEEFIARVWPDEPAPRHVLPVIDVVEQARVSPIRVCIDMGPGHAKTTTLLRLLIWWLLRSPKDQCAYVTYSSGQAMDKSSVALTYADSASLALRPDSTAKGHWHTPEGGGLIAAGARGKLTGQRVPGLLLYDDPYKDEMEARSAAVNFAVKERFKAIAFTRLQGGSIIVLHTRWSEDDLIGWLLRDLGWDSVHIPTVCDAVPDSLGRRIIQRHEYDALDFATKSRFGMFDRDKELFGEVAWPSNYPYAICTTPCGHDGHLAEIRATIGEHLWSAMYQGSPRPIGKAIFHEPARFRLSEVVKNGVVTHRSEFTWAGKRGVIMMDPAASAKTSSDYTVMLVLAMSGLGADSKMWIVDCIRIQEETPEVVVIAKRLQTIYRLMIGVETVGVMRAVPQMLRRVDRTLRVLDVEVGGKDKFTRSIPLSAAWNDGRVFIPIDVPWADTLIDEFKKFTGTNDQHDDQVDAGSHGWNVLYRDKPRIKDSDYAQDAGV